MFLIVAAGLLAVGCLYAGWQFYRSINWDEPAEPSPDLQGMHKREAQLLHIQEVLAEAGTLGKLSKQVLEEFDRYCEAEIQEMRAVESAWRNRRKQQPPSN